MEVAHLAYMPDFGKKKGEITDLRQVMSYIHQLEDQIRYALSHIDGGNITQNTVGAQQLAADAVTSKVLAKGSVTGEQLAQDSVSADNLSPDAKKKIEKMIADADDAQLGSGGFRQAVNTLIAAATISYTKLVDGQEVILTGQEGGGILFQRLRLRAANLQNLPEGQILIKKSDGLYAIGAGGAAEKATLGAGDLGAGAVTAEKLGDDTGTALAGTLNAATFFARADVKAQVRAIINEGGA